MFHTETHEDYFPTLGVTSFGKTVRSKRRATKTVFRPFGVIFRRSAKLCSRRKPSKTVFRISGVTSFGKTMFETETHEDRLRSAKLCSRRKPSKTVFRVSGVTSFGKTMFETETLEDCLSCIRRYFVRQNYVRDGNPGRLSFVYPALLRSAKLCSTRKPSKTVFRVSGVTSFDKTMFDTETLEDCLSCIRRYFVRQNFVRHGNPRRLSFVYPALLCSAKLCSTRKPSKTVFRVSGVTLFGKTLFETETLEDCLSCIRRYFVRQNYVRDRNPRRLSFVYPALLCSAKLCSRQKPSKTVFRVSGVTYVRHGNPRRLSFVYPALFRSAKLCSKSSRVICIMEAL